MNRNLNRRIRQLLYSLKRAYGSTLHIYTLIDAETDYTTGVKSSTQKCTKITRGIVLPIQVHRETAQSMSLVSANKNFVYGGVYSVGTRLFVVDARDVPRDFEIDMDDWLVYDRRRFNIKSIDRLEQNGGWLIVGHETEGTPVLPHVSVRDEIQLSQGVTHES